MMYYVIFGEILFGVVFDVGWMMFVFYYCFVMFCLLFFFLDWVVFGV